MKPELANRGAEEAHCPLCRQLCRCLAGDAGVRLINCTFCGEFAISPQAEARFASAHEVEQLQRALSARVAPPGQIRLLGVIDGAVHIDCIPMP